MKSVNCQCQDTVSQLECNAVTFDKSRPIPYYFFIITSSRTNWQFQFFISFIFLMEQKFCSMTIYDSRFTKCGKIPLKQIKIAKNVNARLIVKKSQL